MRDRGAGNRGAGQRQAVAQTSVHPAQHTTLRLPRVAAGEKLAGQQSATTIEYGLTGAPPPGWYSKCRCGALAAALPEEPL